MADEKQQTPKHPYEAGFLAGYLAGYVKGQEAIIAYLELHAPKEAEPAHGRLAEHALKEALLKERV